MLEANVVLFNQPLSSLAFLPYPIAKNALPTAAASRAQQSFPADLRSGCHPRGRRTLSACVHLATAQPTRTPGSGGAGGRRVVNDVIRAAVELDCPRRDRFCIFDF